MKRRIVIIFGVISILSIVCVIIIVLLRISQDQSVFFSDYENATEVREVIISDFGIGEAKLADVESVLENGHFGHLFCYPARSPVGEFGTSDSESDVVMKYCEAPTGIPDIIPGHYTILFTFGDETLIDVQVRHEYK